MAEPKFQLRLDLQTPNQSETSLHLQSDYSNMKRLQKELQRAVDELSGTHSQRLTRYIT
jgi:ABC-type cobalamin transport system ATPase subunit